MLIRSQVGIARHRRFGLVLGLAFALLSACSYSEPYEANGKPKPYYSAEEAAAITAASSSVAAGTEFLKGTTLLSLDEYHGTQIEYLSPDGSSDLWYPGNKTTVPGRWKVIEFPSGVPGICFLYGSNTYNPVTRQGGGKWECDSTMKTYLWHAGQIVKGDPFRLDNGRIPFVLPRQKPMVLAEAKKLGGAAVSQAPLRYLKNVFTGAPIN